jgi:transposase
MNSISINASSTSVVAKFYGINSRSLQRQYKDYLSDFKSWDQKQHAKEWLLFAQNLGSHLSLDETAFSNGDLYTILTNKKAKGKKGALVAMVKGTKADVVIKILHRTPLKQRNKVKEVTLDMAGNMGSTQKVVG